MTRPMTIADAGQLNPSVSVEAYFLAQVGSDVRRTQFRLREHADVAAWLLSFLDYLLFKQGRIQGERRIASPPTGSTMEALIRGGVILREQRPDGRLSLRLSPDIGEMGLYLYARRHDGPALDTAFSLGQDPDLSRWLLTYCLQDRAQIEKLEISEALAASLRRHEVLVDQLPAADVYFPDPQATVDLAGDLAVMSRVFPQAAGAGIPDEVRDLLRQVPALPPDTPIVWGEDAGTGLVFPVLGSAGHDRAELERIKGAQAPPRAAQWCRQLEVAREAMRTRRYAVLREILPPAQRARLRHYVRQLADRGYFPPVGLDKQVELRRSMYRQPTIASLHNGLARLLSQVYGQPLVGSFNQLGLYEAGSILERHTDRPQCVLNLSLVLDMYDPHGEPEPWPIYIEMNGRTEAIDLQIGDGLAYSGVEVAHWRDALPPGRRAICGFFFFVPPDFAGSLD